MDYDKTEEKLVREHKLTIRWLMTAVRALWSPLKQCKLRARHSKRAWLHICRSRGPKDSSEWGECPEHVTHTHKGKWFLRQSQNQTGNCTSATQNVCGKELQLLSEEGHVGLSGINTLQNCDWRLSLRRESNGSERLQHNYWHMWWSMLLVPCCDLYK